MATTTVDLTNCDREPIHVPGSIQPHGALIACDPNADRILRVSANVEAMLGIRVEIGTSLADALGADVTHTLRNALSTAREARRPALLIGVTLPSGRAFDIAIHRHLATAIIEFEPAAKAGNPLAVAREFIGRIIGIEDIDRLVRTSARLVKGMLGYDRVMIYRFQPDGSGKVVAETKRPDLESFLGQYFPATDIPKQARTLYLQNTIRIISDARGGGVPIEPVLDPSGEPLDLSFAHLRSVSPIHLEYLRNMGVGASMSVSIIIDGELWGLIACHHYSPRVLPMAERVGAEMFGEFFSLHLNALRQKRRLEVAAAARASLDRFMRLSSHHADVMQLLRDSLPDFIRLMPADGVGVWMDGRWTGHGLVPPADAIPSLVQSVASMADGRIWATHDLAVVHPPARAYAQEAAGVLAIPLSQRPRDYLLFFRRELEQTLEWAGNPEKSYETGPLGDRLTPRRSFAIWKETVRNQSQPWSDADREIAEAVRSGVVEVVLRQNELTADERAKAEVRQRMLNEELNHRVKNILAVIKSLVGHPVREGRSLVDYVASLKGRIQALSFAHDQVVRGDGGGSLADLLNAEILPYRSPRRVITLAGPPVHLDSRAFSVMALVLHELATNAAKYGALSVPTGHLDVEWTWEDDGSCEILWRESGGPPVSPPSRQGLGSALIDRSIPYDLGGESSIAYEIGGVAARFLLPARHVTLSEDTPRPTLAAPGQVAQSGLAGDPLVLLVEDQMLIAMDAEAILADNGVTRSFTAKSATEALSFLASARPDIAVLDVNLGDGTSISVARELARRGVPFIFATGYGDSVMIPDELKKAPLVRKPYDAASLIAAMKDLLQAVRAPDNSASK